MTNGIDISKHNVGINNYIQSASFVILRAGYGKHNIDAKFLEHYKKVAHTYNKPYGAYWFSYALSEDMARNEAKSCIDILKQCDIPPSYPIYFDLEYDSQTYFKKQTGRTMTKDEVIAFTKAFCSELENQGYYAGYYTNKDYYNRYYKNLTQYTTWLADYKDSSFNNRPNHIHMIQYTSTPLDKDTCKINFPDVIKKNHLNGW